jgi:hypothetical protein
MLCAPYIPLGIVVDCNFGSGSQVRDVTCNGVMKCVHAFCRYIGAMLFKFHSRALPIFVGLELICILSVMVGLQVENWVTHHVFNLNFLYPWKTNYLAGARSVFPTLHPSCKGELGSKTHFHDPLKSVPAPHIGRSPENLWGLLLKRQVAPHCWGLVIVRPSTGHSHPIAHVWSGPRKFCSPTFPWGS